MLLKMLNPRNLQAKIELYGYKFSYKKYLLAVLATVSAAILLGKVLYLDNSYIVFVVICACACIPFFILSMYKRMYEQKRFVDAGRYIENAMYAFMRHGQVLPTLQDVYKTYSPGQMSKCINKAIAYIVEGKYENDLYQEAFAFIEKEYKNDRIFNINRYMIEAERLGGERSTTTEIFIEDKTEWEYNIGTLQQTKNSILKAICVETVVVLIFCWAFLFAETTVSLSIAKEPIVQLMSTFLIVSSLINILVGNKAMATNWLENDTGVESKKALKEYWYVKNYDEQKAKRESYLWAAPFCIAAIVMVVLRHYKIAPFCIVIAVFMLNQHKLDYKMARKTVEKCVSVAFPQWITNMTLLLQSYTVQLAIRNSIESAPEILRPELEELVSALEEKPDDIDTYQSFFQFLNQEDIKTAMQILYSVSETGNGNTGIQLANLQRTNMKLKSVSEKLKQEDVVINMELVKNYPLVLGSVVQLFDLVVFMNVGLPSISTIAR